MALGFRLYRLGQLSADAPNRYEVDPLEYLAERVISADPPYVTNEMTTLALQTGNFLDDDSLPEEWRQGFLQRMVGLCRSGSARARINAAFLLSEVSDASGLVREALAGLRADGTMADLRAEIGRHLDALAQPPADMAERAVWASTQLPSVYLLPGMTHEPKQTLMGPAESERRARARALAERARAEEDRGHDRQAAETWAEAARLVPTDRDLRVNGALCLVRVGEYEQALPLLERLCEERPVDARCHSARGAALIGVDRPREALSALDQALELDPGRTTAVVNKAEVLATLGRHEEAEDFLRAVVQQEGWRVAPEMTDGAVAVLTQHALHAALNDRHGVVADLIGAACELRPEAADGWLLRAYAAQMLGHLDQAEEYGARANSVGLRDPAALIVRAEMAYQARDFRTAVTCADLVLAQDPQSAAALWTRARAGHDAGNASEAVGYYARYLAQSPDDGRTWNDLGVCFQHAGDNNRALVSFKQAVEKDPDDGMHWANLALATLNVTDADTDIPVIWGYLSTARQLQPESETTLLAIGVFHHRTGNNAAAEQVIGHLLRIAPDHMQAHALLAQCRSALASEGTRERMSGEKE